MCLEGGLITRGPLLVRFDSLMTIIDIPIKDLVLYERNSNTHSAMQIERLAKSIKEFGFLVPCVVKTRPDGKYDLAAGHGRLAGASRAKLKTVPCVLADHLTGKQLKAYVIADNKLGHLGEWDMDILAAELSELDLDGYDMDTLGFDQDEADRILGKACEDDHTDAKDGGDVSNDPDDQGGDQGAGAGLKTSIAYNIVFDTDEQQQTWFLFLRYLKENVDAESIGARLRVFIAKNGFTKE